MLNDIELSKKLIKRYLKIVGEMERSIIYFTTLVSEDELKKIKVENGKIIYDIWEGIITPNLSNHPSLDIDSIIEELKLSESEPSN